MFYKINGVLMPSFTSFQPESNNLYGENTGRDEAGYNHLDLIRANVRKWKIKHEFITRAELDKIKSACGAGTFNFTGLCSEGVVTAECYAKISGEECKTYDNDGPDGSLWSCEVSIVEM